MDQYLPYLQWLDHQKEHMKELVVAWANINSHATNYKGLQEQLEELKKSFAILGADMQEVDLPPHNIVGDDGNKVQVPLGKALHIKKRPDAAIKVLLGGHMDTVYSKNSSFQRASETAQGTLIGPGVTDMKGGLVVLLYALQALEKSPYAKDIAWEVLINPDEEIGSPGSKALLEKAAKGHHIGLFFEPAHRDGALVSDRPGSINLVLVIKGKAAHAGRDFTKGRSALVAAAALVVDIDKLNTLKLDQELTEVEQAEHAIINVGEFRSGTGFNIVSDLATVRVNIRAKHQNKLEEVQAKINELVTTHAARDGIWISVHEISARPPKTIEAASEKLGKLFAESTLSLEHTVTFKPSYGVSDGNILTASGLATLDTLGPVGGDIHTHNEYLVVSSLLDRAKQAALFLMRLGAKEVSLDSKNQIIQL